MISKESVLGGWRDYSGVKSTCCSSRGPRVWSKREVSIFGLVFLKEKKKKASTPALVRQRQADLGEFESSPVYIVSFRTARATQRDPVSSKKEQNRTPILEEQTLVG